MSAHNGIRLMLDTDATVHTGGNIAWLHVEEWVETHIYHPTQKQLQMSQKLQWETWNIETAKKKKIYKQYTAR